IVVSRLLGYGPEIRSLLVLLAICTIPGNLGTTLSQGFRGHDRMELEAITNIVNSVCNLAFLLLAMKLHGGLRSVVLAGGGSVTVALVLALVLARKVRMPPLHVNWQRLRGILAGGAPFVFFNLALSGHPYVDANLLAMLASPSVVGWYAAAQRFVGTLIFPAGIAGVALYPTLARFAGDASALRSKARDALRLVLMLGALVAAGTALYADVAISLTLAELIMTLAALRLAPDGIVERGQWRLAFAALASAAAMLAAGGLLRNAPLAIRFVVPLAAFAVAIRATGLFAVADGRRIWEAARLRSHPSRA